MQRRRTFCVAFGTAAAALVVAGCGDDGSDASAADAPDVVTITAVDFAFHDVPASVPAGTELTIVNESDTELHELVAFRIPDDDDRPVSELVQLPFPELMAVMGGEPELVLLQAPGGEVIPAVGDPVLTEPGRYALICVIPTGADPAEYITEAATSDGPPDVDGGPPHIVHGMFAELTVTG